MADNKKPKVKKRYDKEKRKSIILYWIVGIVILIPIILLGSIYLGAKESAGKPTTGNRFANQLNPAISQEQMDQVKTTLSGDGVETIEISLKSATLRIMIKLNNEASLEEVESKISSSYDAINGILPIDTYFKNKDDGGKMYDLDIHVYNFMPDEGQSTENWAYVERTKNASNADAVTDTLSSAKNGELADSLLADHSQPAEAETQE